MRFIGPKLNDAEQYARLTPYSTIRTTNKLAANAASFAMAVFSRPPGRLRIKLDVYKRQAEHANDAVKKFYANRHLEVVKQIRQKL